MRPSGAGTTEAGASPSSNTPALHTICQYSADQLPPGTLLTSTTVCQGGLTPPSLWWTRDLVESDLRLKKLVNQWTMQVRSANEAGLVNVVVNPQLWSVMNYFERYEFLNSFGLAVQEFGYNLRLSDLRGALLGDYNCQFTTDEAGVGAVDARTVDARTVDARTVDARTVDARTVDARTVDARTVDAGTIRSGTISSETGSLRSGTDGARTGGNTDRGTVSDTDRSGVLPQGRHCRLKLNTGSGLRARSRTGVLNSLP